jgi:Arc/MetJ-type ribon-helix-helix transcriptional regulator
MPAELLKELRDHVKEKKKENPIASASDIIRALVREFLKNEKTKRKR